MLLYLFRISKVSKYFNNREGACKKYVSINFVCLSLVNVFSVREHAKSMCVHKFCMFESS